MTFRRPIPYPTLRDRREHCPCPSAAATDWERHPWSGASRCILCSCEDRALCSPEPTLSRSSPRRQGPSPRHLGSSASGITPPSGPSAGLISGSLVLPRDDSRRSRAFVPTLFLTAVVCSAISLCILVRRGARSRGVAATGPGAVLQQPRTLAGRRPLVPAGCQVSTPKRTACEAPSGSSTHPIASSRAATRATLDHRQGSQRKLRAPRRWLCDISICPPPGQRSQSGMISRSSIHPSRQKQSPSWPSIAREHANTRIGPGQ
jgi:hypothetical protein